MMSGFIDAPVDQYDNAHFLRVLRKEFDCVGIDEVAINTHPAHETNAQAIPVQVVVAFDGNTAHPANFVL